MTYQPPYTITPEILNRVAAISEMIGRLTVLSDQARALRLRRINRIRTIRGSLAIEGNTLSEAQITAILETSGSRPVPRGAGGEKRFGGLRPVRHLEPWCGKRPTGGTSDFDVRPDQRGRALSAWWRGRAGGPTGDPHDPASRPSAATDGRPLWLAGQHRLASAHCQFSLSLSLNSSTPSSMATAAWGGYGRA